jgi:hypothetical protein
MWALFWALIAVSIIMAMWAAYEYITANGEEEKITTARRALLYAACGIIVALIARGAPCLIETIFNQPCTIVSSSIVPGTTTPL